MRTGPFASRRSVVLVAATGFLLLVGLLVQFSIDANAKGLPVDFDPGKQVIAICIGIAGAIAAWRVSLTFWFKIAPALFVGVIGLLVLVRRFGVTVYGAKRWILLAGYQLQPSELAKPALALMGARVLPTTIGAVPARRLIGFLLLPVIPVALVLTQPDLGTSIVLIAIWYAQLMISALEGRIVLILTLLLLAVGILSLPLMSDYQRERITSFVSQQEDESEAHYNVVQARIAIGSGGLVGRGLEGGTQSQLNFLPSQHTDFIFAVVAEKLGLLGAMSVLIAEVVVAVVAWRITASAVRPEHALLAAGIATAFSLQAVINISMNVGLLPVTGIPLPFVSYGGTSVLVGLVMVGWLLAVDQATTQQKRR